MLFNIWCSFHFSYSCNLWNKAFSTTVQNIGINNTKTPILWFNFYYTTNFFQLCFCIYFFHISQCSAHSTTFCLVLDGKYSALPHSVHFCQMAPKTFSYTITVAECIAFIIINSGSNIQKEFQSLHGESHPEMITAMLNEARLFLMVSQFISFSCFKSVPKLMMTE